MSCKHSLIFVSPSTEIISTRHRSVLFVWLVGRLVGWFCFDMFSGDQNQSPHLQGKLSPAWLRFLLLVLLQESEAPASAIIPRAFIHPLPASPCFVLWSYRCFLLRDPMIGALSPMHSTFPFTLPEFIPLSPFLIFVLSWVILPRNDQNVLSGENKRTLGQQ